MTLAANMLGLLHLKLYYLLLNLSFCVTAWPRALTGDNCPSSKWNVMCRPCCEYHLIQCQCPSKRSRVGYTVPCCRNALDQCDPCIIHPGCSLFENCKTCNNGTWKANDNFFINGKYCTECRQGWSGGDCKISAIKNQVCALPGKPVNGYLLPVYGPKEELVSVNYQCHPPFILSGSQKRICLPSGTWSGRLPTCVKDAQTGQTSRVRCAAPPKLLNGYHRRAVDAAGGAETIEFFCKNSYVLSGNHQSTCLTNGSWSSRLPKCVRACREPRVSELVQQHVVKPHLSRYNVHDLLSAGFIPLTRDVQSKVEKDDANLEELPRGFHPVYTSIEYKCASPLYHHTGSSRRTCLKTGRWSGSHVSCSPVCGKFDSFSTHNVSDTRWPWHAAIYIRSPPDHTASTHRARGMTMSEKQGISEESLFWYLACSGALLTQHSVLVTAQCVVDKHKQQPLHPAHVKVVIGIQHHPSKNRLKSLHHLRVSDILVHPDFYSTPDSDVAVLKLKDKAKVSEYVLPACLPKMQEVTVQDAYTARWILPNNHRLPSQQPPLSQTEFGELRDAVHCEREYAEGGSDVTTISDKSLCVFRRSSTPQISCPSVIPGLTLVPGEFSPISGVLSGHSEARRVGWQLVGLESFSYEEKNCHQQTYRIQTRTDIFRDWIEKNMK
ncbi:inactive serine protease PAMR1 isoform X2 [Mastacembelus armatus]|uniref:Peptidase domain containing associated with muscle regeneration 1a n=1 Tax=Mastacembelus armatus TaxID=205130 RepID=A0A3Q3M7J6_9TELE|nr:inactive serine protease PAMR1-like isoform X2 [Mastacembelus armatus]